LVFANIDIPLYAIGLNSARNGHTSFFGMVGPPSLKLRRVGQLLAKKCEIYGEKSKMSARRHFPQGHTPLVFAYVEETKDLEAQQLADSLQPTVKS
jgi:hypothetical protein